MKKLFCLVFILFILTIAAESYPSTPVVQKACPAHIFFERLHSRHLYVFISNEFSDTHQAEISSDIKEWQDATDEYFQFTFIYGWNSDMGMIKSQPGHCANWIYVVPYKAHGDDPLKMATSGSDIIGWSHPICQSRFFFLMADKMNTDEMFRNVVIHEMGHILGLEHTQEGEHSIMTHTVEHASVCIEDNDLYALNVKYNFVTTKPLKDCHH